MALPLILNGRASQTQPRSLLTSRFSLLMQFLVLILILVLVAQAKSACPKGTRKFKPCAINTLKNPALGTMRPTSAEPKMPTSQLLKRSTFLL
uniref:SCY domain-containing protein n=1 Tax=Steinernema glaseri TaxID=37863 RepID=A0A1I7YAB0_9BILA